MMNVDFSYGSTCIRCGLWTPPGTLHLCRQITLGDSQPEQNKIDNTEQADITCPFCHNNGFDLIGLKCHLLKHPCTEFDNLDISDRKGIFEL